MSKIAIITDTNSCISIDEAKKLGIYLLPMPFIINEETYFEGVTMSAEDFYEKLINDENISTSQPTPDSVMNIWDEALREADEVVHIPMSSALSGAFQTAVMLSEDYDGKVHVVDAKRISFTMKQTVYDAITLAKQGFDGASIKSKLEEDSKNATIYLTIDTLKFLKKGGRLSPVAAALGTILKIKPILTILDDKIDSFAKSRTLSQAKATMLQATLDDVEKRLGGLGNGNKLAIAVVHNGDENIAREFQTMVQEAFPDYEILLDHLSLSIAAHTGPNVVAIACVQKNF